LQYIAKYIEQKILPLAEMGSSKPLKRVSFPEAIAVAPLFKRIIGRGRELSPLYPYRFAVRGYQWKNPQEPLRSQIPDQGCQIGHFMANFEKVGHF